MAVRVSMLETAQNIARGYMAPGSHSINVFAQSGKLYTSKDALLSELMDEVRLQQLTKLRNPFDATLTKECDDNMEELLRLCDFVEAM